MQIVDLNHYFLFPCIVFFEDSIWNGPVCRPNSHILDRWIDLTYPVLLVRHKWSPPLAGREVSSVVVAVLTLLNSFELACALLAQIELGSLAVSANFQILLGPEVGALLQYVDVQLDFRFRTEEALHLEGPLARLRHCLLLVNGCVSAALLTLSAFNLFDLVLRLLNWLRSPLLNFKFIKLHVAVVKLQLPRLILPIFRRPSVKTAARCLHRCLEEVSVGRGAWRDRNGIGRRANSGSLAVRGRGSLTVFISFSFDYFHHCFY